MKSPSKSLVSGVIAGAAARDVVARFDSLLVKPQWSHPLLDFKHTGRTEIAKAELRTFAYDYYLRFLPFFRHQPEGSIEPGVEIEFTRRMRQKLGLAYLFEHKIRLNEAYFAKDPSLLPYTLFHEMTHLWLYDCLLDPGHTRRFYNKMAQFEETGLPVDPDVHIHTRVAPEGKYVYSCPNCKNRWYLRERLKYVIYCGHCFDKEGVEYFAKRLKTGTRQELAEPDSAA
jgi:predicted SprT family Zn-dependent metalloprotease